MAKEEIFNKHSVSAIGAISPSRDFCLKAMDEYAKTTSLAYDQWKIENRWFSFENGYWYQTLEPGTVMSEKIYNKHHRKTPEQLYDQFIEQQNKDNA